VGEHLLAALHSEGIEAVAAQMQQLFALGVAQLLPAHQVVGASLVAGDAVAGEHLAHHPLDAFCVVIDLCHVFAQDPAGHVLRGGWGARWGLGGDRGGTCSLKKHLLWAMASHPVERSDEPQLHNYDSA
jgi:hypothetical protein